jgi:hypothetical protein
MAADIDEVSEQFKQWRQTRQAREKIPQELWDSAARLASKYSVNRVSKALRISYEGLRKRLGNEKYEVKPSFMELGAGNFLTPSQCIVELEKADGSKMRLMVGDEHAVELISIGKAFCGI